VICRDHSDLDMKEMQTIISWFGHRLHHVLTQRLNGFEVDPYDVRKTNLRYQKEVIDITTGYYQGVLIGAIAAGKHLDVFAVMILAESVGFSPEIH